MIKQFYLTDSLDPNGYYYPGQSRPGSNNNERGSPYSSKLHD